MATNPSRIPFSVMLGVAWALTCAFLLLGRWHDLDMRLFDADDAMRLVQVREFIGGRGWFDLFEPRLDPATGYDTHWSRLIDAGLTGLYLAAQGFGGADVAEKFMRAAWPLLWLLAAMAGVAAIAWRIAGRRAAVLALVIAALAVPAFQHFKPGRIDHHNVQIALALAVVAATAWSDRARHAAALAGVLTALAVAIGLESFPFIAAASVAFAARFIFERRAFDRSISSGGQLAHYGLAVAIGMTAIFALVVKPQFWGHAACDTIAVNWLAASAVASVGCWIAGRQFSRSSYSTVAARAAAIALIAGLSLAVFLVIEPRCIGGPFALTDRIIKTIWLDHVDETAPLLTAIYGYPLLGVWMCAFPLAGLICAAIVARDATAWRDFGFWLPVVSLMLAILTTFAAVKIYSYAMWFAMPLVAAVATRISTGEGWRAHAARLAAAVLLAPTIITGAGILITQALAGNDPEKPGIPERIACTRNDAYGALTNLPRGVVAAEINYGPYVLALTPHTVLAAPYHRIHGGIVAADAILTGPEQVARVIAEKNNVEYIAICGRRASTGDVPPPASLWAQLNTGQVPVWLEPLSRGAEKDFAVYRVRR